VAVDSIFKFFSFFYSHKEPLSGKVAIIIHTREKLHAQKYTHTRISREEEAKRMVRDWRLSSGWLASSRGARLKREREERRAV